MPHTAIVVVWRRSTAYCRRGGVLMATARAQCETCGNGFLGTPRSRYCTPACRQKAHRRRGGRERNAEDRNVTVVVATAPAGGHTAEALAMLTELDAELADSAAEFGEDLAYSAADRAAREAAAFAIDRTVWLRSAYDGAGGDAGLRLKLMAELRLTEQAAVKLLRQVNTDPPAGEPSTTSQKASAAAARRWKKDRARRG